MASKARYEEDPNAGAQIVKLCGNTLDKLLPAVARDAQRYVPVLSGYLRNHIGYDQTSPTRGRVYANADYAAAVERGWVHPKSGTHVPAQPYLRPALHKNRDLA